MLDESKDIFLSEIFSVRSTRNYVFAIIIFLGSIGFLFTSLISAKSYFVSSINFSIFFLPQGLLMGFYGFIALVFSLYLGLIMFWNVGSGYNEFNKIHKVLRIFRWGFPGQNRRLHLIYNLDDIKSISVNLKTDNLFSERNITAKLRFDEDILLKSGEFITLESLEKDASDLAVFLQVPLKFDGL